MPSLLLLLLLSAVESSCYTSILQLSPATTMLIRSIVIGSCCLLTSASRQSEILKRNGDYFLRLQNHDGNLVMDEGDIPMERTLKAPMFVRKKRIAHARDYQKFLKVSLLNLFTYSPQSKQKRNDFIKCNNSCK